MILAVFVLFAFALLLRVGAVEHVQLSQKDVIRIVEATRLSRTMGHVVWDGWDTAPFALLLVTQDFEYLFHHPNPSEDFQALDGDSFGLGSVYFRKRVYPTNFLATFPAVNGVPTIVVGQAEHTDAKSSTRWVLTVLHEHFHQLQMSRPGYFEQVNALDLSGGDTTGMWMLNFPFPYENPSLNEQFSELMQMLHLMLFAKEGVEAREFSKYWKERLEWKKLLSKEDYRYFSFQVWQEGISRYTEWKLAGMASESYEPTEEFKQLPDYLSFAKASESIREELEKQLTQSLLKDEKRVAFYPFGAAEGILLDRLNVDWRKGYFSGELSLENLFPHD